MEILENIKRIINILGWFTSPSVYPYIGIFAAIGASIFVDFKQWVVPVNIIYLRVLKISFCWILIACLMGIFSNGSKPVGGEKGGDSKKKPEERREDYNKDFEKEKKKKDGFENEKNKYLKLDVLIEIRFVALQNDKKELPFSCDINIKDKKTKEIRSKTTKEFNEVFKNEILKLVNSNRAIFKIYHSNAPGLNAINRIKEIIIEVFPEAKIEEEVV